MSTTDPSAPELAFAPAEPPPPGPCGQHPDAQAPYYCDGCRQRLCTDCITEGHALLFCNLCGERALPFQAAQPTTTRELARQRVINQHYTFKDALGYPFRGTGLYLYIITLLIMAFLWVFPSMVLRSLFGVLLAGLQLEIVRTTVRGDDVLPDWPDFSDTGARFYDSITMVVIGLFQMIGILPMLVFFGFSGLMFKPPNLIFWIEFAIMLWLGTAFSIMALGAAGTFWRMKIFEIHHHVIGFVRAGKDAIDITNMTFGFGGLLLVIRIALGQASPFFGAALGGALGAYWLFVSAHLTGILFRRQNDLVEALYGEPLG